MGGVMMYFDFLKDHVVNCHLGDEEAINWSASTHSFIRSSLPSQAEIAQQEARLQEVGYEFPELLKAFWTEIGCGYLCTTESSDHALQEPNTALDLYFHEGDWSHIKLTCDILDKNELPFFRINDFRYLTIGLEEGVNLGKIYCCGEEIASNLIEFVEKLLFNPTCYIECTSMT